MHAEGYTPLMVALHRGRLECAKALLRAGADPNFQNYAGDHSIFWAIDGGVEIIKLVKVSWHKRGSLPPLRTDAAGAGGVSGVPAVRPAAPT